MEEQTNDICREPYLSEADLLEAMRLSILHNPENAPVMVANNQVDMNAFLTDGTIEEDKKDMFIELATQNGTKWRDGYELRIRFLDGNAVMQKKVETYIREWDPFINLRLKFTNDPSAEIKILIGGPDPWSYVGTQALVYKDPKVQTMQLGLKPTDAEWLIARRAKHEFGHALGCVHEHQSPASGIPWDVPAVYSYYSKEGKTWVDQNILGKYNNTMTNSSEFDPASVMIYPIPATLTKGRLTVGWNINLSAKDKEFIRKMYPQKLIYNFNLHGKADKWQNTGVILSAGQQARITATGSISFGPMGSWPFTPAGESTKKAGSGAPGPGLIANALVARAGGGPVYIGNSSLITAQNDGPLQVASNDDFTLDNDGVWNLIIEVFHK